MPRGYHTMKDQFRVDAENRMMAAWDKQAASAENTGGQEGGVDSKDVLDYITPHPDAQYYETGGSIRQLIGEEDYMALLAELPAWYFHISYRERGHILSQVYDGLVSGIDWSASLPCILKSVAAEDCPICKRQERG